MSVLKFKSEFVGLLKIKDLNKLHSISYTKKIQWYYVGLFNILRIEPDFNIHKAKVGAYWFNEKIIINSKRNNWFIPKGSDSVLFGELIDVLLCDFHEDDNNRIIVNQIDKDLFEVKGNCYFQVALPSTSLELPDSDVLKEEKFNAKGDGLNFIEFNGINQTNSTTVNLKSKQTFFSRIFTVTNSTGGKSAINHEKSKPTGSGCFSNSVQTIYRLIKLIWVFGLSFLLGTTLVNLWGGNKDLFYVLLVTGIIWYILRGLKWRWLSTFVSLILFGLLAAIYKDGDLGQVPIKLRNTKEGKIKISPPKPTNRNDDNGNSIKDQKFNKQITWHDFINNEHNLTYNSFSSEFIDSKRLRERNIANLQGYNDPIKLYNKIYARAVQVDDVKLDSIVLIIKEDVKKLRYNKIDAARAVITLIQEIPYVLVHDNSCQEVIKSDPDFVAKYHKEGKPCLPQIRGGVQTPYEFMHNLKGDCDTRSLLAHFILNKLDIPSSIWVSMAYGHSILGVGLPVGVGHYKEINGVKHYAVELTAKGFDLGMISPEQTQMNNWDIALHN